MSHWDDSLAGWWVDEVGSDPAYERDVDPLVASLVGTPEGLIVDIGCGEGRMLGRFGRTVGVDASAALALRAARRGPVVVGDVGRLPLGDGVAGTAIAVLVLEHLEAVGPFFAAAHRVVVPGGALITVVNHPAFTAPGSGPFIDDDGEVLWRWGAYLEPGWSDEPGGGHSVRFYHHPLGSLLSAAADAGWSLRRLREVPTGDREDPLLAAQGSIPRLLGVRWEKLAT